jgi:hypothetical protein
MRGETLLSMLLALPILSLSAATLPPASAVAELACSGHKLLRNPRAESSCSNVKPAIYASPDGALRALVFPADVSLYATPDMESRIVIRSAKGDTLTSKDYSSPRGTNGYYVVDAKWSPDSQFLHGVVGRSLALVISDDGVQPPEKSHCRRQRNDRGQTHTIGGFPFFRPA